MAYETVSLHSPGANMTTVDVGNRTLYFSYETCIAARIGVRCVRRDRTYSKTTAKHMGQMGVKDWDQLGDIDFLALVGA